MRRPGAQAAYCSSPVPGSTAGSGGSALAAARSAASTNAVTNRSGLVGLPGRAWSCRSVQDFCLRWSPAPRVTGSLATSIALAFSLRFDAVFTREDGARGKPHPDLYLAALSCLKLAPSGVLAVEDSANGVAAAIAAGLRVAAVPNAVTSAQVRTAATVVLDPVQLRNWIESLI